MKTLIKLILVILALGLMAVKSREARMGGVEIGNGRSAPAGDQKSEQKAGQKEGNGVEVLALSYSSTEIVAGEQIRIHALVELLKGGSVEGCGAIWRVNDQGEFETKMPVDDCELKMISDKVYWLEMEHRFPKRLSSLGFHLDSLSLKTRDSRLIESSSWSWRDEPEVVQVRVRKSLPEFKVLNAWVKTGEVAAIRRGRLYDLKIQVQSDTKIDSVGHISYDADFGDGPENDSIQVSEVETLVEQDQDDDIVTVTVPVFVSRENVSVQSLTFKGVSFRNHNYQILNAELPWSIELKITD